VIPGSARAWGCVASLACALLTMPVWSMPGVVSYSDGPLDAAELFDQISPSIWLVMTADEAGKPLASGSAVVIAPGLAVTNCHVLAKSASVTLRHETVQLSAQRDVADEALDLCLLTSPELHAPAVTLGNESTLRPGMRVYAIGSPRRLELTISDGLLSALRRNSAGALQLVQTSAPISPGSSGGGLFDGFGRLIGITSSGMRDSQNLNFAVPARLVAELARRSGPAGRTVTIAPSEPPPTRAANENVAIQTARVASTHAPSISPPSASTTVIAPAPTPTSPIATAPAPTPAPAPAPSAAAAASSSSTQDAVKPASSTGVARPKTIEYDLQDRLTGRHRKAIYRADSESGSDIVSFNNGGWVEKPGGEVISVSTSIAGEFDLAMPPAGWGHRDLNQQKTWQAKYSSTTNGERINMDLRARVVGDARIRVGGREFDTVQIEYRGFTERSASSTVQAGSYSADVWYSPELGRPVRFEVLTRGGLMSGAFFVSEKLELVDIR
jgi:serine protease Do